MSTEERQITDIKETEQNLSQPLIAQEHPEEKKSIYQQRINSIGETLGNISSTLMKMTTVASIPLAIIPSTKTTLDNYHKAYVNAKESAKTDSYTTGVYNNVGTLNSGMIETTEIIQGSIAMGAHFMAFTGGLLLTTGTVKNVMLGLAYIGAGVAISSVNTMFSLPEDVGSSSGSYQGYKDGWCEEIVNSPECSSNIFHDRTSHDLGIPQRFWVGTITAVAAGVSGVLSGVGKKMKNYQDPPLPPLEISVNHTV